MRKAMNKSVRIVHRVYPDEFRAYPSITEFNEKLKILSKRYIKELNRAKYQNSVKSIELTPVGLVRISAILGIGTEWMDEIDYVREDGKPMKIILPCQLDDTQTDDAVILQARKVAEKTGKYKGKSTPKVSEASVIDRAKRFAESAKRNLPESMYTIRPGKYVVDNFDLIIVPQRQGKQPFHLYDSERYRSHAGTLCEIQDKTRNIREEESYAAITQFVEDATHVTSIAMTDALAGMIRRNHQLVLADIKTGAFVEVILDVDPKEVSPRKTYDVVKKNYVMNPFKFRFRQVENPTHKGLITYFVYKFGDD